MIASHHPTAAPQDGTGSRRSPGQSSGTAALADELRKAEAAYRAAARQLEAKRDRRNAAIRRALAEGWSHARIADVTGLSRGRISQLR